jgi:ubiquinol-cytochrome c reductase cytochrome c1 subunit
VRVAVLAAVLALGLTGGAVAQEGMKLDAANNNIENIDSLQRGAKYFVNYCLGCHSAKYVRYNRLAADLEITEQQLVDNLMFTGEHPYDTMTNAMRPADSTRWFGRSPPDLSLMARARGPDYIFTFLRSFYVAPERPTGVDNVVLPGTAMPDVLWKLQGVQRAVFTTAPDGEKVFEKFESVAPGQLTAEEYDGAVRDIVNFLDYIGEPIKREREQLGIRVIGFLLVFLLIAYMLKKEIWKDVE